LINGHSNWYILFYKSKAAKVLKYYKPAKNLYLVKKQINYQMRYSLLFTLAKKHKTSTCRVIQMIGKDASIYMDIGKQLKKVVSFLSSSFINSQATGFSEIPNIMLDLNTLKKPLSKVPIPKLLHHECQIKGCVKNNIKIFHIRALHKKISSNFVIASVKISNKKML
jgi:Type II intron maturase